MEHRYRLRNVHTGKTHVLSRDDAEFALIFAGMQVEENLKMLDAGQVIVLHEATLKKME